MSAIAKFSPSRRALLRGHFSRGHSAPRPPWSIAETLFTDGCTRCDGCIDHCPERILVRGDGGYPEVHFSQGECTFCGQCADHCPESLFRSRSESPWTLKAQVNASCLTHQTVICRSCGENCEVEAIGFALQAGKTPHPSIDAEACTGCGACVSVCPVEAIHIDSEPRTKVV